MRGWLKIGKAEHTSRVGQSWRETVEYKVVDEKRNIKIVTGFHHFTGNDLKKVGCQCGEIVRVDQHGWAYCGVCGQVYNYQSEYEKYKEKLIKKFHNSSKVKLRGIHNFLRYTQ